MDAYKQYNSWTLEEKHQYHEEWNKYKESFHDEELEKNIDKLNIEIEDSDYIFHKSKNDFEITYKTNHQDMDQLFSHIKDLNILFEKGFKWFVINEKMQLYKTIYRICRRALRSPETNICGFDRQLLCLFVKDNLLYAYSGACYYRDNNTFSFNYVGRILEQGEARQLSIFDI